MPRRRLESHHRLDPTNSSWLRTGRGGRALRDERLHTWQRRHGRRQYGDQRVSRPRWWTRSRGAGDKIAANQEAAGRHDSCDLLGRLITPQRRSPYTRRHQQSAGPACNKADRDESQAASHPVSHTPSHFFLSKSLILLTHMNTYDPPPRSGTESGKRRERPCRKPPVSGPGRCASVTPAAPGRSPLKSSLAGRPTGSAARPFPAVVITTAALG